MLDQIAVVSDVHGNVSAFEAVLADIDSRGIERILNLGDVVGKGPRGSEAVALSRERCETTIRGNWDAILSGPAEDLWPAGRWVRDRLTEEDVDWLASLPATTELVMSGQRIRLFHASQVNEFHRVRVRHTQDEFRSMFANTEFTGGFRADGAVWPAGTTPNVVGYGDIHQTYLETDEGLTLFNAGSVGNHLDGPSAPYVVLEGAIDSPDPGPLGIHFIRVPYDIEAEVATANALGMPDAAAYALELREGIYRGRSAP